MSETPKDLFPAASEGAMKTAHALSLALKPCRREDLTPEEQAEFDEAVRFARGEVQMVSEDELDEPDRSIWPVCENYGKCTGCGECGKSD